MAVGLSAGTTTWALAKELVNGPRITVVTNSVRIADLFHHGASAGSARFGSTVILIGGERTPSDALVGPIATAALKQLHLDVLFLGVHGMDADAGFTTPNLLEAETDRAFVAAARNVVVLADHTKWGMLGICTISALDEVDEVISDSGLAPEARRILAERIGKVRIAG
jgi:DeoR family glycerol-3-phosphate regulon repressor